MFDAVRFGMEPYHSDECVCLLKQIDVEESRRFLFAETAPLRTWFARLSDWTSKLPLLESIAFLEVNHIAVLHALGSLRWFGNAANVSASLPDEVGFHDLLHA